MIRDARPSDLEALRRIFRRASLANIDDRDQLLAHPEVLELSDLGVREGRVRLATADGGRVVGFATVLVVGHAGEIEDLFVDPDWMGRGVGRELVGDIAARARQQGLRRLEVTANPHARGFYEKLGFVFDQEVPTRFSPAPKMHLDLGATSATP